MNQHKKSIQSILNSEGSMADNASSPFKQTRKLYFSLPRISNPPPSEDRPDDEPNLYNVQKSQQKQKRVYICSLLSKESPLEGSPGFRKFQLYNFPKGMESNKQIGIDNLKSLKTQQSIEYSAISKDRLPFSAQNLLKCIRQNAADLRSYTQRYNEEKSIVLSKMQRELQKEKQLAGRARSVRLFKPVQTTLAPAKQALSKPEYSDNLQKILFPNIQKQEDIKKKLQSQYQTKVRKRYLDALVVKPAFLQLTVFGPPPQSREGVQIAFYNGKIYVLGGSSNSTIHVIQVYDIMGHEWSRKEVEGYRRRSFHTVQYQKQGKVLLVGGFREATMNEKRRLATNIQQIDLDRLVVNGSYIQGNRKLEPRYSHSTCMLDQDALLISGGRTVEGFKRDAYILDVVTQHLEKCKDLPVTLYGHTTCMTADGAFMFGGKTENGDIQNTMFKFQRKSKSFFEVNYSGRPPAPCQGYSMIYLKKSNVIVFYGGKNNQADNPFLNQIHLYHVGLSMFTEVASSRMNDGRRRTLLVLEQQRPRVSFAASTQSPEDTIYLFGGLTAEGFTNYITMFELNMKLKHTFQG